MAPNYFDIKKSCVCLLFYVLNKKEIIMNNREPLNQDNLINFINLCVNNRKEARDCDIECNTAYPLPSINITFNDIYINAQEKYCINSEDQEVDYYYENIKISICYRKFFFFPTWVNIKDLSKDFDFTNFNKIITKKSNEILNKKAKLIDKVKKEQDVKQAEIDLKISKKLKKLL